MNREYFMSKRMINKILAIYGGRRKYSLSAKYTTDKKCQIVFTEKKDCNRWLTMTKKYVNDVPVVVVTLTDESGYIIRRDNYSNLV